MVSERRRLVVGAGWTFASTVVGLAVGAILRPVIVAYTGVDGYGIWAAVLALASLFAFAGDLGVSGALTKIVAERRGRQEGVGTFASSALVLGLAVGVFSGLALGIFSVFAESYVSFANFALLLQIQAVQIPVNLGVASLLAVLQGHRRLRGLALTSMTLGLLHIGLATVLLSLGYGLVGAMGAGLVASIVVLLALLVRLRRDLPARGLAALRNDLGILLPFGVKLTAANVFTTILYQVDVVILLFWTADATLVGTYALAVFITRALWVIPGSFSVTTYPVVSEYAAARSSRRVSSYLSTAILASTAITGCLATALVLFGKPILQVVFGLAAVPAYDIALVLLLGTALLGTLRSVTASISSIGRPDVAAWISGLGAALLVLLSMALTPAWSAVGTAIAVTLSFTTVAVLDVWAIDRYVLARDRTHVDVRRIGKAGAVSLVAMAVSIALALSHNPGVIETVMALAVWTLAVFGLWRASGGREAWATVLPRFRGPTTKQE